MEDNRLQDRGKARPHKSPEVRPRQKSEHLTSWSLRKQKVAKRALCVYVGLSVCLSACVCACVCMKLFLGVRT